MSNENNINISPKNISGKCDLKCSYNFKYSESNITAKNDGVMISLTYDNTSTPPVLYNGQKYTVTKIYITCPSIHRYNGDLAEGEFIIEHSPVNGGKNLSVAIPLVMSSESSTASNLITDIIESVSNNAPSEGDSTNLNISGFTLQKIVPEKPFYNYTDNNDNDWIVFGILFGISLNENTITNLSKVIKPFYISTKGKGLFLNSSGPNSVSIGDGIYISCKPTGSSEEEVAVTYDTNETSNDLGSIFQNSTTKIIFQIIIGCLLFILLFMFFNVVYVWITTGAVKLPSMKSNNNE
jgi:carbonic anhydrase